MTTQENPNFVDELLEGFRQQIRATADRHNLPTPKDLSAVMIGCAIGVGFEQGLSKEDVAAIAHNATGYAPIPHEDTASSTALGILDGWYAVIRKAVIDFPKPLETKRDVFAFVFEFVTACSLGTGLSKDDLMRIFDGAEKTFLAFQQPAPAATTAPAKRMNFASPPK